jgi:hypothetical protein
VPIISRHHSARRAFGRRTGFLMEQAAWCIHNHLAGYSSVRDIGNSIQLACLSWIFYKSNLHHANVFPVVLLCDILAVPRHS